MNELTRRQREIFDFLRDNYQRFAYPPTLDELCAALGMASRGSLYKHIMALIGAGLVEPFTGNKQGGIRLTGQAQRDYAACEHALPFVGRIAAGKPIEALENINYMAVPEVLEKREALLCVADQGRFDDRGRHIRRRLGDHRAAQLRQQRRDRGGADREGRSDPEIHRAVAGESAVDPGQFQHDGAWRTARSRSKSRASWSDKCAVTVHINYTRPSTRRAIMPRRIHMQDQVSNKVEEIMSHYDRCYGELWGMKVLLLAAFLVAGCVWVMSQFVSAYVRPLRAL